jgi:hypothetical protein
MKNILLNIAILYLLRLTSLFFIYPVNGIISKYLLNNDVYQIKYFTFLSIWYFSIASLIYGIIWAICFYLCCYLIRNKMNLIGKISIISFLIFISETFFKYHHYIINNKTFFSDKLFEVDFYQYLIGQIMTFLTFLYLYVVVGSKIIKRPTILP